MQKIRMLTVGVFVVIAGAAGPHLAADLRGAAVANNNGAVPPHIKQAILSSLPLTVEGYNKADPILNAQDEPSIKQGDRPHRARKEALISPEAWAFKQEQGARGGASCYGDGLNLAYPFADDGTWTLGLGPNDDGSAGPIGLPFTFPLYGDTYSQCWINNNGNLSFTGPYYYYSPVGFPSSQYVMVAPFWGDVDTRSQAVETGLVWYRFADGDGDGANETLVVTWDNVGYYSVNTDKLNTFQVVISDGSNPDMGLGNTVCFSYDNMCWTTGDASGGAGGFGGYPATVGCNRGDGTDYFQIGRFDHPGSDYDGPFGNPDGVSWLDGQHICVNTSSATNIPPIPQGFPADGTVTLLPEIGDPLDLTVQFLSPEAGQTTSVTIDDLDNAQGLGLAIDNTPGNVAEIHLVWSPDCSLIGTYSLEFTAQDDFAPPGVTVVLLTINVGTTDDCNGNSTPDECDIAAGTSEDCNGNRTPDECELVSNDCNSDGIPDDCQIEGNDCNTNGTLDDCESQGDCDGDGTLDICEPDCNENGISDICDILDGTSEDCQSDGIPDECQLGGGGDDTITIDLFTDNYPGETTWVLVEQASGTVMGSGGPYSNPLTLHTTDVGVDPALCYDFTIYDSFGDGLCCGYGQGWYEVHYGDMLVGFGGEFGSSEVVADIGVDCGSRGGRSEGSDCNENGVPDECDIADGTSSDCNGNGLPDECEEDCNGNGTPDDCDIADGTSQDCNGNDTPDECDMASGVDSDCQPNGTPDSCDLDLGDSEDCNANGVPDDCDIAMGNSGDCNENGVPDDCEWEEIRNPGRQTSVESCQWPDQQSHGGAYMVPVGGDFGGFRAESFVFMEPVTITNVQWWGTYADACGVPCEPTDDFVLTFHVNETGPASTHVATYAVGSAVGRTPTGQIIPIEGGFAEYEYTVDLVPPLVLEPGNRYWVDLVNNMDGQCLWWWETAPEGAHGNGTSLYDAAGDGYGGGDLVPYDLAFCVSGLPASEDCNGNGIEDAQDISVGTSQDCQPNGIPDDCEPDGNYNSIPDDCDIVEGTSQDDNFNGLPDEADCLTRPGDMDGNCEVSLDDYSAFFSCLGMSGAELVGECACADFDGNAIVDVEDYLAFSVAFGVPDEGCFVTPEDACPDSWVTGSPAREDSFYDFGAHGPIPAGFFGEGSDPFGELVALVGRPADPNGVHGEIDTQIQHGPVIFDPVTGVAVATLDIITLDLISRDPITVTYNGGQNPEEWLLVAGLSRYNPGSGELTANLDDPEGNSGTFDATVYVQPAFLFVKLQDLIDELLPECLTVRILDTGEFEPGRAAPMPPITLSFAGEPFVRVADPEMVEVLNVSDCAQGSFVPGIIETSRGGRTGQQLTCTSHITEGEAHYFCPPECQGDDVCKYTKSGGLTPIFCNNVPTFPQETLGGSCPNGVGDCTPFTVKMKSCSGGGFAVQVYANPTCVSRESTCKGACCDEEGTCVMSTAALCEGTYQGDDTSCSPNPCPKVDVDIDSDNNGAIAESDDSIEMNEPGKLIYLNQDDDNKNDTEDRTENTTSVTDENDLQAINLSTSNLSTGEVVLSAPTGAARIQVWTSPTKGPPASKITLPKTWALGAVPATLYVEGIGTGAVVLKLANMDGATELNADQVKAGVVGLDFKKRADTTYGYDDGTVDDNPVPTSADNPPQKYDWVSVDNDNKTTDVNVEITPAAYATYVFFVSSNTSQATASPAQATATPQKLTITGKATGKPNILCRLGTTSGAAGARLNVGSYAQAEITANFYKVRTTAGLVPDGTTGAQFESGANGFMKRGVSSLDITDNGTSTIDYDIDGNTHLDIDTGAADGGAEWKAITDGIGAVAGQKLLHIKNALRVKIGATWFNATGLNWGEWIVVTDASASKTRTLAHEALHNLSLADTGPSAKNTDNIMYYVTSATKYFVGYFKVERVQTGSGNSYVPKQYELQWDTIDR